jgi:hypothetical protein
MGETEESGFARNRTRRAKTASTPDIRQTRQLLDPTTTGIATGRALDSPSGLPQPRGARRLISRAQSLPKPEAGASCRLIAPKYQALFQTAVPCAVPNGLAIPPLIVYMLAVTPSIPCKATL